MKTLYNQKSRKISYIYLLSIPVIGFILAFNIGYSSYKIYVPLWIINSILMVYSAWVLGFSKIRSGNKEAALTAKGAFLLIIPFILISMFAGLGPPPETAIKWVETMTEQQVRYFMLVIAGIFIAFGFAILREKLREEGENYYSKLGWMAISIAIPLFIINMLYWGFYLSELFKIQVSTGIENRPEWFVPIRKLFGLISVVEVSLTYLATALFAISFNITGKIGRTSCRAYVLISCIALLIIVLSAFFEEQFLIAGFIVSIPAVPFIMPYLIALNLLKKI